MLLPDNFWLSAAFYIQPLFHAVSVFFNFVTRPGVSAGKALP
jgi:hypothetical protein